MIKSQTSNTYNIVISYIQHIFSYICAFVYSDRIKEIAMVALIPCVFYGVIGMENQDTHLQNLRQDTEIINNWQYIQQNINMEYDQNTTMNNNQQNVLTIDLNVRNAFYNACIDGDSNIVQNLISSYPNIVNTPNEVMNYPITAASEAGHLEIVQLLIDNNVEVDSRAAHGFCALHLAAMHNRRNIVEYLVTHGANINAVSIAGSTALHLAAQYGYIDVVQCLIQNRADVNRQDGAGHTALHLALAEIVNRVNYGMGYESIPTYLQITRDLIVANASMQIGDNAGITPHDMLFSLDDQSRSYIQTFLNSGDGS